MKDFEKVTLEDNVGKIDANTVRSILGAPTFVRTIYDKTQHSHTAQSADAEEGIDITPHEQWYYVMIQLDEQAYIRQQVTQQEVVVLRFDQSDQLVAINDYGLESRLDTGMNAGISNTYSLEQSFLLRFLSSVGRYRQYDNF